MKKSLKRHASKVMFPVIVLFNAYMIIPTGTFSNIFKYIISQAILALV